MARIKGGVTTRKRRKKILKLAEGYFGSKHALYRTAHEQVMHSLMFAYRDRRQTKRNFRRLWIARINAAAVANEFKYSKLIHGLSLANVQLNRKVLSDIAITEPAVFTSYVELAKDAIANPSKYSQKKTEKVAVVAEVKVEVKEVVKKETPKKEVVKPAPQVVKQAAPVTEKEVKQAELGLSSILATALRDTAIFEGVENARTAKKAELIKALAKLGYKPAVAELPLEDLLFTQLKDMAQELNIEGYTSLKKVELIEAIRKAQK